MIEIVATFAPNTIQDLGRLGRRHLGISTSGVMDPLACRVGNLMLGNAEDCAVIEVQVFPFSIRFHTDLAFAVTGADCASRLGEKTLPPWWAAIARKGEVLTLPPPTRGTRASIAVPGGIDVPLVIGSRSTHLRSAFGGFAGRPLATGDRLAARHAAADLGAAPEAGFGVEPPDVALPAAPQADGALAVRVLRGGEYDLFPEEAQRRFWAARWKITPQSDRAGYRLTGEPLRLPAPVEMRSYGVVPGIVQVPPSGEPIVQMSDANTAGGYPKMAGVIEADMWRLGQARPGSFLRFVDTDYDSAVAAMAPVDAWLGRVRADIAALRGQRSKRTSAITRIAS